MSDDLNAEKELLRLISMPYLEDEEETQGFVEPNYFIPADRTVFENLYKQLFCWIETCSNKIQMLSGITNLWTSQNQEFYLLMHSYFTGIHHVKQPEIYLPSIQLYEQMFLEFEINKQYELVDWLTNYNASFISKIQKMIPSNSNSLPISYSSEISDLVSKIIQVTDHREKSIQEELVQTKRKYDELVIQNDETNRVLEELKRKYQKNIRTNSEINKQLKTRQERIQSLCQEIMEHADPSSLKKMI